MPRGRSTFTKPSKKQSQQKEREKAERRDQQKEVKPESASVDEIDEMCGLVPQWPFSTRCIENGMVPKALGEKQS
jgi:hypothetical protein